MSTQIITVPKATWTLLSSVPCTFANQAQHVFYTFEASSLPTILTAPVSELTARSGRGLHSYIGGSGNLYVYSPGHDTRFQIDEQTTPIPAMVALGSVEAAWQIAGEMTAANIAAAFTTFVETNMQTATADSFLEFDISPASLLNTFRTRLGAQSEQAIFDIYKSKEEPGTNERFYDRVVTITADTGASAVAAEAGGYYADTIVFSNDASVKGFAQEGNKAKISMADLLTGDKLIIVCTTMPASNSVAIDHSIG